MTQLPQDLTRSVIPIGSVVAVIGIVVAGLFRVEATIEKAVAEKAALFALHSSQHTAAIAEVQRQLDRHATIDAHPGALRRNEYDALSVELIALRTEVQKLRELMARIDERVNKK